MTRFAFAGDHLGIRPSLINAGVLEAFQNLIPRRFIAGVHFHRVTLPQFAFFQICHELSDLSSNADLISIRQFGFPFLHLEFRIAASGAY
jgi:hypothetical protein